MIGLLVLCCISAENSSEKCKICLSGKQKLSSGQETSEQMPILPVSEVSQRRHG